MEKKLDFDDVLIVPRISNVSSRAEVDVTLGNRDGAPIVPIIAANMYHIGTLNVASILSKYGILTALVKGVKTTPELYDWTFETFGMDEPLLSNKFICLDVANGYLTKFHDRVKRCRDLYPTSVIMAGNVVTPEGVECLVKAGADIIKVGLGSGGACTTRLKSGVGYPQLSAILECSKVARRYGAFICSDGGHRTPGDIVKSFVGGADFVMLGGMFAGTDETGTTFYGNASKQAQGTLEKYRAEEGRILQVPYRGKLEDVVQDILGGIRSACTYVGAKDLYELKEKATFVRVQ